MTEHPAPAGPRAVGPIKRLRGRLRLPSDKSVGHRALIVNALGGGSAIVELRHAGADIRATIDALGALGAQARTELDGERLLVRIDSAGWDAAHEWPGGAPSSVVDCANSGTSMRLLAGALALSERATTLTGDASLSRRPMERVALPLRGMGATVDTTDGHAPLTVRGARPLRAAELHLPVASAQVLGAIALAALGAVGMTTIVTPGPTRDHTERLLAWLGVPARREAYRTTINGPAQFTARDIVVPGDPSAATFWLVAAAIHPDADIRLEGVCINPTRLAAVAVLREMGARIVVSPDPAHAGPEPTGTIEVRSADRLRAVSLAGPQVAALIDELPVLAIAMAAADGTSRVRDATELRVKESDRIALIARDLRRIGARVGEEPDGWTIAPGTRRDAAVVTAGDHRIAMAFAIAAVTGVAGHVSLDDPGCVEVSYPSFWADLATLGGATEPTAPLPRPRVLA